MEFSNISQESFDSSIQTVEIEQEVKQMPESPCLRPLDVSLQMYLQMGVFYLQETDQQSCQSQNSTKSVDKKKRISKKKSRKQRKNTNSTQIDQFERGVV